MFIIIDGYNILKQLTNDVYVSEKERYEVRVEGEEKNILIRPNNLEVKSNA